jgi:hypothetical protein
MPTVYKLSDLEKASMIGLAKETLDKVSIQNRTALLQYIYADRPPVGLVPHGHDQRGGQPLKRAIATLQFGPGQDYTRFTRLDNTKLAGLPLLPSDVGTSMANTPKNVGSFLCMIPGGLATVKVYLPVSLGNVVGSKSATFSCEIRPLTSMNYKQGKGEAVRSGNVIVSSAAVIGLQTATFAFNWQDQNIFHAEHNNLVEIVFFLHSDIPSGKQFFLTGALVVGISGLPNIEGFRFYSPNPLHSVNVNEIQEGKPLVASLTGKFRAISNDLQIAALGRAYGLNEYATAPDSRVPWSSKARIHQHRGKFLKDPRTGKIYHDGVVPQWPLVAVSYASQTLNSTLAGPLTTMPADPVWGTRIHNAGILNTGSGWQTFNLVIPISEGMRSFNLFLALQPRHKKPQGRLDIYLKLIRESDMFATNAGLQQDWLVTPNLIKSIRSQFSMLNIEPENDADFVIVPVKPLDQDGFYSNEARLGGFSQQRNGLWTEDALLPTTDLPPNINPSLAEGFASIQRKYPARACHPIEIVIGNSSIVPSDPDHDTDSYVLMMRFALSAGEIGAVASFQPDSALLSALVLPGEFE